jgi:hypothetical protein
MANEKWSTWASMGALSGTEKLVGLDTGNSNEYTTPDDLKTYIASKSASAQSASGTSVDFTGLPSGVKLITVGLSGISTNGSALIIIQIGDSGGVETSSYASAAASSGGGGGVTSTAGYLLTPSGDGAHAISGVVTLMLVDSATNTWSAGLGLAGHTGSLNPVFGGGVKSLSGTLDRVRLTTSNGTDVFDAGKINIVYE